MYVVQPAEAYWFGGKWPEQGQPVEDGFRYSSAENTEWLNIEEIREIVAPFEEAYTQGKLT
jgi:UDP-N-acetylglucosamine 4,6-dehydratase